MKQLSLPLKEQAYPANVRFLAARLSHVPLREVFRSLFLFCRTEGGPGQAIVAVGCARARRARDGAWRRRLYWLLGEICSKDDRALLQAADFYSKALESRSPRSAGFDIACLRARSMCLARAGCRGPAQEDQARMHALLARSTPVKQRADFLFDLAEEQFADHGLLDLARENYGAASPLFEGLGDVAKVASCEFERGKTLFYKCHPGCLDEALGPMLAARRLWSTLGDTDNVRNTDGELTDLFMCRGEPLRALGAATRKYLGAMENPRHFNISAALPLWNRAVILALLDRPLERDRALRQAIWLLESEREPWRLRYTERYVLPWRIALLDWLLKRLDVKGAREAALLLLPLLPRLDRYDPNVFSAVFAAFGRLGEVFRGQDVLSSVSRALRPSDQAVAADVRWLDPRHPLVPVFLGRGLLEN